MGTRPRLLDLFCCAGGAAKGYHNAGFDVVGIDIKPQPRYPFPFIQGDALEFLAKHGLEFDAIHASPPCQAYSDMKHMPTAGKHPELIVPTRELLLQTGRPYAIENVEGAPMGTGSLFGGITLCGSMFGLRTDKYELRRHRLFEVNPSVPQPSCDHSDLPVVGFYGDHARIRRRVNGSKDRGKDITGRDRKLALVRELMGIDWMEWEDARQAIPPAYTEYIGRRLMDAVRSNLQLRIPLCSDTAKSEARAM